MCSLRLAVSVSCRWCWHSKLPQLPAKSSEFPALGLAVLYGLCLQRSLEAENSGLRGRAMAQISIVLDRGGGGGGGMGEDRAQKAQNKGGFLGGGAGLRDASTRGLR